MFKLLNKIKIGKGESGLGMVEMALVTPLLMVMAFGLYDVSTLLHNYFVAHKAAQKTLRYAVAIPGLEPNAGAPHNSHGAFAASRHGAVIDRANFLLQGYGLMRPHDPPAGICGYYDGTFCGYLPASEVVPYVESKFDSDPCINTVEITIGVRADTFLTHLVTGNDEVAVSVVGPYLFAPAANC